MRKPRAYLKLLLDSILRIFKKTEANQRIVEIYNKYHRAAYPHNLVDELGEYYVDWLFLKNSTDGFAGEFFLSHPVVNTDAMRFVVHDGLYDPLDEHPILRTHIAKGLEKFQKAAEIRRATYGIEPQDDVMVRIADMSDDYRLFTIQKCKYSIQKVTSMACDSKELNSEMALTLREMDIGQGKFSQFSESFMANTIGVAVALKCADGHYLITKRSTKTDVMNDGSLHCSSSGALDWDKMTAANRVEYGFEGVENGMFYEIEQELNIKRHEVKLTPLAFAREVSRGGKPQFFFHGETGLTAAEIRERMKTAIEHWEFEQSTEEQINREADKEAAFTFEGMVIFKLVELFEQQAKV